MEKYNLQDCFDIRFEWGLPGINELGSVSDVVILVDVLSFTTAVDVATSQGAIVYPCGWGDPSMKEFASKIGAKIAVPRCEVTPENPFSLSPETLLNLHDGDRIILPSLNGSTLAIAASKVCSNVLAGCLRNAKAVAQRAMSLGQIITVIACGERWDAKPDAEIRFAVEDLLGAGAILFELRERPFSSEAMAAISAFKLMEPHLEGNILHSSSGVELYYSDNTDDISIAAELNASTNAPLFKDGAFIRS